MKSLFAALVLGIALTASALTLKWSVGAEAFAWSTDGLGALALVYHTPAAPELGVVTWVDRNGRGLFTNVIADLGQNPAGSSVRIIRFNPSELAVQVEANYEYAPGTNFIRRFRRNGTFSDTVLTVGTQMDAQSSALTDRHGYFTRTPVPGGGGYNFSRYSN